MSNNRMYLVHRPTGNAVYLGKRYGDRYFPRDADLLVPAIDALFDQADPGCDEFCIALECPDRENGQVGAVLIQQEGRDGWDDENGLRTVKLD